MKGRQICSVAPNRIVSQNREDTNYDQNKLAEEIMIAVGKSCENNEIEQKGGGGALDFYGCRDALAASMGYTTSGDPKTLPALPAVMKRPAAQVGTKTKGVKLEQKDKQTDMGVATTGAKTPKATAKTKRKPKQTSKTPKAKAKKKCKPKQLDGKGAKAPTAMKHKLGRKRKREHATVETDAATPARPAAETAPSLQGTPDAPHGSRCDPSFIFDLGAPNLEMLDAFDP